MKKITTVSIIFSILLLTACTDDKPAAVTEDAIAIRTKPVTLTDYKALLEYSGKLTSSKETNLSFKVGGIIAAVYAKEGEMVSKGQLLATLDLTEINAQVQQAMQNVEKSNRDVQRVKNLFEDTAATLEQYQNVQTQQNVAGENLRIAKFNQQYAQIRATENGVITKKLMNAGELAAPGTPILEMNSTSDNDWVVRFGVSDKDWAQLQKGDEATVDLDAYPETNFKGIISKVAQAADPVTGTYEIEVKVLPGDKKFATGLFSKIQINTATTQQVSIIPVEALSEADGKTGYVYTLNADKKTVTKHKVEIASIDSDKVAIRSGLENISEVITDGVNYLTENAKVKEAEM